MTRKEFINWLIDELSEGGTIPSAPNKNRINTIISNTRDYYYELSDLSHEFCYIIIDDTAFHTDLFKARRQIEMPKAVHAVVRIRTISGNYNLGLYNGKDTDFKQTNWNFNMGIGGNSNAMLTAITYNYYTSFLTNFIVTDLVYAFNQNTHMITVEGVDVKASILAECSMNVPEEKLFDDVMFRKYCLGKCKISFGNIIGFTDQKLIGGYKIDFKAIKDEGKDMVKEVETYLKEYQQSPADLGLLYFD